MIETTMPDDSTSDELTPDKPTPGTPTPRPGPAPPPEPVPPSAPSTVGAPVIDSPTPPPDPPAMLRQESTQPPGSDYPPASPPPPPGAAASTPSYAAPPRRSAVPLLLGSVALLVLILTAAAFYLMRVDGRSVLTGGTLSATVEGLRYDNAKEKIAFIAPAAWSKYPTTSAQVMVRGNGCSFGLLEQHTMLELSHLADAEAKDLHRRHPEATPIIAPRALAGRSALAFSGSYPDSDGAPMTQTYILIDRGVNVLTLIETSTDAPACALAFDQIENSLRI